MHIEKVVEAFTFKKNNGKFARDEIIYGNIKANCFLI